MVGCSGDQMWWVGCSGGQMWWVGCSEDQMWWVGGSGDQMWWVGCSGDQVWWVGCSENCVCKFVAKSKCDEFKSEPQQIPLEKHLVTSKNCIKSASTFRSNQITKI